MRILLDECVHAGLKELLPGWSVTTVPEAGLTGVTNGDLLRRIRGRFEIFLTVDQGLCHQQNLRSLPFAVVILEVIDNRIESYHPILDGLRAKLSAIQPGEVWVIRKEKGAQGRAVECEKAR